MTTAADLLADLNDRLDDIANTKWSEATKIRYMNRGQAAMFPKVHRIVRDSTLAIAADTWEYNIPSAVGNEGKILLLEIEDAAGRLYELYDYVIVPGVTDPILRLKGNALPGPVAANIRVTAAKPLTAFATSASTYTGSSISEELPILYAMSLCMASNVERRYRHTRMPSIEGASGVTGEDFMTASQFWMQQFELILDRIQMPLPVV